MFARVVILLPAYSTHFYGDGRVAAGFVAAGVVAADVVAAAASVAAVVVTVDIVAFAAGLRNIRCYVITIDLRRYFILNILIRFVGRF